MEELIELEDDIELLKSRIQMKYSNEYDEDTDAGSDKISPFNLLMRIRKMEKQMQQLERDITIVNRAKKDLLRSIHFNKSGESNANNSSKINIQDFVGKETSKHLPRTQLDGFTSKVNNLNKVLAHLSLSSSSAQSLALSPSGDNFDD